MSLTGLPLQILLVVLTVVLFAATVRLWPRLARRGVRPLAGRTGLVLLVQLSLLCTVAAAANTYFAFYTDWDSSSASAVRARRPTTLREARRPASSGSNAACPSACPAAATSPRPARSSRCR